MAINILQSLNKIYTAWGKDTSSDNFKNNYWVYLAAALNGVWGSSVVDNVTVHHIGQVCFWKTDIFTATGNTTLTIPIQSNVAYTVLVCNISTGAITCLEFDANTNSKTFSLSSSNKYQIISLMFKEKGI
jgi:hypothetical protein